MAHPIARSDLLELEDRLLDEGFGYLLSILPRELFQLYNERIFINKDLYPLRTGKANLSYAYLRKVRNAHVDVDGSDGQYWDLVFPRLNKAEIAAFENVPPLSWHDPPDSHHRSSELDDHAEALIKYFLLVWASNQEYDGRMPQPSYKHLAAALHRLIDTRHYQDQQVIHEDEERADVHKIYNYFGGFNADQEAQRMGIISENDDADGGHEPRARQQKSAINPKAGGRESRHKAVDTRLPTPHQSPQDANMDVDMFDSGAASTRGASVASADDLAAGVEVAGAGPLPTDAVMNGTSVELEHLRQSELVRQSMPTPDTLIEEAIVEADPTLRDIQKKLGTDALSLLPDLRNCNFRSIHTNESGFLSLRLLLGTLHDTPKPDFDGAELWASFKMHDKNDRAAPRMHVHAFSADSDDVLGNDLKIKDILPYLKPGAAFNTIAPGGDRAEELLLKALVKYYYIIAAREKHQGFDKHKMPYNDSFADQLKIAVKRTQTHVASRVDAQIQRRPYKRQNRSHDPTPTAVLSDADDDVPSLPRTRDARRSGRRTGQPSSAVVSESEDNVPLPPPVGLPQRSPRRLALGVKISHKMETPAVNEFLDPEADPADSEGDSGDEIPGPISADLAAFLQKRHYFQKQSKAHSEVTKIYAKKKEGAVMGIRKVKGMLNKHEYTPEARARAERDLTNRHVVLQAMETHLKVRDFGVTGWKKRAKEMDTELEASGIPTKVLQTWNAVYKKDDY